MTEDRVRNPWRRHRDHERNGANNGGVAVAPVSPSALSLKTAMRRLWSDHAIWTREYIVAAVNGGPDAGAAAGRLLRNQEDIGNALVPFYGPAIGPGLTALLKEHILIAVDLVAAAKAGDTEKFTDADHRWSQNAARIAGFLSGLNQYWPEKDVHDLLDQHLLLTKNEAVARLNEKWDDDVEAFDQIFTEILTVADALSDGLLKQFPGRF